MYYYCVTYAKLFPPDENVPRCSLKLQICRYDRSLPTDSLCSSGHQGPFIYWSSPHPFPSTALCRGELSKYGPNVVRPKISTFPVPTTCILSFFQKNSLSVKSRTIFARRTHIPHRPRARLPAQVIRRSEDKKIRNRRSQDRRTRRSYPRELRNDRDIRANIVRFYLVTEGKESRPDPASKSRRMIARRTERQCGVYKFKNRADRFLFESFNIGVALLAYDGKDIC